MWGWLSRDALVVQTCAADPRLVLRPFASANVDPLASPSGCSYWSCAVQFRFAIRIHRKLTRTRKVSLQLACPTLGGHQVCSWWPARIIAGACCVQTLPARRGPAKRQRTRSLWIQRQLTLLLQDLCSHMLPLEGNTVPAVGMPKAHLRSARALRIQIRK